ncbi:MAG: EAL domain-containing protein [Clostridiales bacterium]|nr:EAL domain-containing protein [Clostridiales bacterium]
MDYDERKIFVRGRTAFALTSILYAFLFIGGLFLQRFIFIEYAQVIISIFLLIASFFLNLLFGIPGYWITTAFTLVQIFIYSSSFSHRQNTDMLVLLGMALLSILVNTMFEFFIIRVSERIDTLGRKLSDEKAKRISYETSAMISKTMATRPGTIVRHEDIADKSGYAEAVESSRSMVLDPLTTLPNRHMLNEHIGIKILDYKKTWQDASDNGTLCKVNPIYAIYITVSDPVRFSQNNGHIVVDLFIQTMAHRLREAADSKDLLGRIANNEFAIITTRLENDTQVLLYAVELAKALNEEKDGSFYAGIAQYPRDAIYAGELIQHAETAMYDAIDEDTDAKIYEPSPSEARSSFLEDMTLDEIKKLYDKAFDENEIFMVYQPRFDAKMKLTGFEAFVRWECPGHGTVDTRDFLFYAEKTGHIYALGELSLRQSFEALALINEIDPQLTMTVNLSTTQLHTPDLQVDLLAVAEDAGCNLHNIIIDLPSDGATMNVTEIQNTLDAFASSGITMALDNFGRGYSSLNNIPLLPISLVKLDGHFTSDLKEGSAQDVLTRSIISLLNEIDIPVDATNVSSVEQFEKLKEYGCTFFQGIYLSEPLPGRELSDYIRKCSST